MLNNSSYLTGTFWLDNDRKVFGSLYICGKDSKLELFDEAEFSPYDREIYEYIVGELHDGSLVTLLQCIPLRVGYRRGRNHYAQLFPHYIAIGSSHISNSAACILEISFAMKDASALFYDFDAFSIVLDPKPFGPLLQNDKAKFQQFSLWKTGAYYLKIN